MEVPLEVSYKNIEKNEQIEEIINQQVEKLQRFAPDIISCRVALEKNHNNKRQGNPIHVRVEVSVPGKKRLTTTSEPTIVKEENLYELGKVLRDAFRAMEKRLKKTESKKKHQTKTHTEPRAFVAKIFADMGYGFLRRTDTDEEIYFHQNSVLNDDFDRMAPGTEVRYAMEMGEDGPQASSVKIVGKPGSRLSEEEDREDIFFKPVT